MIGDHLINNSMCKSSLRAVGRLGYGDEAITQKGRSHRGLGSTSGEVNRWRLMWCGLGQAWLSKGQWPENRWINIEWVGTDSHLWGVENEGMWWGDMGERQDQGQRPGLWTYRGLCSPASPGSQGSCALEQNNCQVFLPYLSGEVTILGVCW